MNPHANQVITPKRASILCAVAAKQRVTGEAITRAEIAKVTGIDLHRSEPLASMLRAGLLQKQPGGPIPHSGGRSHLYTIGPKCNLWSGT